MESPDYVDIIEVVGRGITLFGAFVIIAGIIFSTFVFVRNIYRARTFTGAYNTYRRHLGRALLLGLELLVAADIIETISLKPSLESVASLILIVLVRTFLSFTLDLEIDGKWPWQRASGTTSE